MKKYFLTENNKELKVGNKIKLTASVNTSYGKGKGVIEVKVTEDTLEKLVKDGLVRVEESNEADEADEAVNTECLIERLKPYIMEIAKKMHADFPTACGMLGVTYDISPKIQLQLLLETIAEVKNRGKKPGKDNWWLNPLTGYKPIKVIGSPTSATVFYEVWDALEAYKTLLPFIKDTHDEE